MRLIHLALGQTLISSRLSHGWSWRASTGSTTRLDTLLLRRATSVREKLIITPPTPGDDSSLIFPSAYPKPDGSGMRGFCNWLIPARIMIGQYPGQNPEKNGPNAKNVEDHILSVVDNAGVDFFCSLQSEIPSQDDDDAWEICGGEKYLPDSLRKDLPRFFSHYAPLVRCSSLSLSHVKPIFLHAPIEDLSVPNSKPLRMLLLRLIEEMDENRVIYIHCWGGRGRAGLVGACLISLLFPEMDSKAVLDLVQAGYDTRLGAASMPVGLSQSPQTEDQREFVRRFVEDQRLQRMKF